MIYMLLFLTIIMLVAAISVLFLKETIHAVIVMTVVSLLASILFLFVAAPDVAITEASIGSALTTIVFVVALRRTVVAEAVPDNSNKATGSSKESDGETAGNVPADTERREMK